MSSVLPVAFDNQTTYLYTEDPELIFSHQSAVIQEKITHIITKYLHPVLLIIGLIGNSLSFATFSRKNIKSQASLYLKVLAIGDSLTLICYILPEAIDNVVDYDIKAASVVLCKVFHTGKWVCAEFSAWILCIIAIQRCILITFPYKAKVLITMIRIKWSVFLLAVVALLLNIPIMIFMDVTTNHRCRLLLSSNTRKILSWVFITLYSFVPFAILIVCNVIIIYQVDNANQTRQNMNARHSGITQSESSNITAILLTISFAYLILGSPNAILFGYWNLNQYIIKNNRQTFILLKLLNEVFQMLMYVNHSLNLLFYCISGTRFRHELKAMLRGRRRVNSTKSSTSISSDQHETVISTF